ncbi:MAG: adenosylcobinamide amidohydrolase [Pseudomonadota bacterium]
MSPQLKANELANAPPASSALFISERDERYFVVSLLEPHYVLSTSALTGGLTTAVRYIVNHQSMKPDDDAEMARIVSLGKRGYQREVANDLKLPPEAMSLMGTAVSMNHLAHAQACFRGLCVDAFVTAGANSNALRAGDPARWYETASGNKRVDSTTGRTAPADASGTINTIVLINRPVLPAALMKISMIAIEAKSAAMSELAIPSMVSSHLATGTGTDQIAIASPLSDAQYPALSSASGHLKLGELVGAAVKRATREALLSESYGAPTSTATVAHALGRFGWTQAALLDAMQQVATDHDLSDVHNEAIRITREPRVVAAAFAFATLLDRSQYGVLPDNADNEPLKDQAATTAAAVSGKPQLWSQYWQQLNAPAGPVALFTQALVLGWQSQLSDS